MLFTPLLHPSFIITLMKKSKSTAIFLLSVFALPIAANALCIGHPGKGHSNLHGVIFATRWV